MRTVPGTLSSPPLLSPLLLRQSTNVTSLLPGRFLTHQAFLTRAFQPPALDSFHSFFFFFFIASSAFPLVHLLECLTSLTWGLASLHARPSTRLELHEGQYPGRFAHL